MATYFVTHTDDDGENFDLIVRARSIIGVFGHWRVHFGLSRKHWPTTIYEVPDEPVEGALSWSDLPKLWSSSFEKQEPANG